VSHDAIDAQFCFCAGPEANNSSPDTHTSAQNIWIKELDRRKQVTENDQRSFSAW